MAGYLHLAAEQAGTSATRPRARLPLRRQIYTSTIRRSPTGTVRSHLHDARVTAVYSSLQCHAPARLLLGTPQRSRGLVHCRRRPVTMSSSRRRLVVAKLLHSSWNHRLGRPIALQKKSMDGNLTFCAHTQPGRLLPMQVAAASSTPGHNHRLYTGRALKQAV